MHPSLGEVSLLLCSLHATGIALLTRLRNGQPRASPLALLGVACCRDLGPMWMMAGCLPRREPTAGQGTCIILRDSAKLPSAEVMTLCNNAGASSSPHRAGNDEMSGRGAAALTGSPAISRLICISGTSHQEGT